MAQRSSRLPSLPSDHELEGAVEEEQGLLEKEGATYPADPTFPNPRKRLSHSQTRLRCITAFSGLLNVLLGGALCFLAWQRLRPHSLHRTSSIQKQEVAGDINGVWPKLSHQLKTFQPDDRYVGNLTSPNFKHNTHPLWIDLVPKGLGFIEVPFPHDHERFPHLPTPYIKYDKPVYTTSATHQLHCLYMIMTGMNELALNGGRFKPMDMDTSPVDHDEGHAHSSRDKIRRDDADDDDAYKGGEQDGGLTREGEDPAEHLSHCFDYLRQAIMCHGDTALEGMQTTFGPNVGGTDGWNVVHVCKKWDDIYDWLEEKRIDDRVWI